MVRGAGGAAQIGTPTFYYFFRFIKILKQENSRISCHQKCRGKIHEYFIAFIVLMYMCVYLCVCMCVCVYNCVSGWVFCFVPAVVSKSIIAKQFEENFDLISLEDDSVSGSVNCKDQ